MNLPQGLLTKLGLGVIVALLGGLGASLYSWSATRDQVAFLTSSNQALRNTLGDMTKAITAKEREIDRLSGLDCKLQSGPPPGEVAPRRTAAR